MRLKIHICVRTCQRQSSKGPQRWSRAWRRGWGNWGHLVWGRPDPGGEFRNVYKQIPGGGIKNWTLLSGTK